MRTRGRLEKIICYSPFLKRFCFTCRRKNTHKKSGVFSGRTTKDLPSLHQWLSGPCQLPGEFSPFIEKKVVFCVVVGGGGLPLHTPLVVRPLKKTLFLCVSSRIAWWPYYIQYRVHYDLQYNNKIAKDLRQESRESRDVY